MWRALQLFHQMSTFCLFGCGCCDLVTQTQHSAIKSYDILAYYYISAFAKDPITNNTLFEITSLGVDTVNCQVC